RMRPRGPGGQGSAAPDTKGRWSLTPKGARNTPRGTAGVGQNRRVRYRRPGRGTMRISELSARTELPVGTIKFYLREGLLAPGESTSRTTAEYDESHVERIRLIRALTDAGGLGIATVRRIVGVLDAPESARLDLLATAQDALLQ